MSYQVCGLTFETQDENTNIMLACLRFDLSRKQSKIFEKATICKTNQNVNNYQACVLTYLVCGLIIPENKATICKTNQNVNNYQVCVLTYQVCGLIIPENKAKYLKNSFTISSF